MRFSLALLLLLGLVAWFMLGCREKPKPLPGGDTTAVVDTTAVKDTTPPVSVTDSTAPPVSAAADSLARDSIEWPPAYEPVGDTAVVDTIAPPSASVRAVSPSGFTGLTVGLSGYPQANWCGGILSGAVMAVSPSYVGPFLRSAARCGFRLAMSFPRALYTTNGQAKGPFSPAKHAALAQLYVKVVTGDTLKKYTSNGTLVGFYAMDDMGCAQCWGGARITQAMTADAMKKVKASLGQYAPVGLRVHTEWMTRDKTVQWGNAVDFTVQQYMGINGEKNHQGQKGWYDMNKALMPKVGVSKAIYSFNPADCYRVGDPPCTPDQIRERGLLAVNYPGNCAELQWMYEPSEFKSPGVIAAWKTVAAAGAAKPKQSCAP